MRYFTLFISLLLATCSYAQVVTRSIANGNWTNPSNWSNGVPSNLDTVYIGHQMTLNTNLDLSVGAYYFVTDTGSINDAAGGTAHLITVRNSGRFIVSGDVTLEGALSLENTSYLEVVGCDTLEAGSMSVQNSSTFFIQSCAVLQINTFLDLGNNQQNTVNGYIRVEGVVTAINSAGITGSGSLSAGGSVSINNTASIFGSTSSCPDTPIDCVYGTGLVLPVEWLYIEGAVEGKDVYLEWATATEQNNDRFLIERFNDGLWQSIGAVEAVGSSNSYNQYSFVDQAPNWGSADALVYQLSQIDFNGEVSYADQIVLNRIEAQTEAGLKVYPNPAFTALTLHLPDGLLSASMYSFDGRLVRSWFLDAEEQSLIDLQSIAAGVYLLQVMGENGRQHQQRIMIKDW